MTHHRHDNAPLMRGAPVFEQKNSLPGAQLHSRFRDRDHFARSGQNHPDVRRHIVRAFTVVFEVRRVFGHEPVEEFFEIAARCWVGVLHYEKAATCVLYENSHCASDDAAAGQNPGNLICDFMGPFAASADANRLGVDS